MSFFKIYIRRSARYITGANKRMPPITAWKKTSKKKVCKVRIKREKTSQSEGGGLTRSLCPFGVIFIGWKRGRNPVVEILCGNSRNQTALFFLSPPGLRGDLLPAACRCLQRHYAKFRRFSPPQLTSSISPIRAPPFDVRPQVRV